MSLANLEDQSIWFNLILFAAMAGTIWYAGTKLEALADGIARRTGLGHAFVGVILLAAATSLSEITTTITAVWIGNLSMAIHNQLGAVVFNAATLAVADLVSARAALTHRSPRYVLILTGVCVLFLLAMVLMAGAMVRGAWHLESAQWVLRYRVWSVAIIVAYVILVFMVHRAQHNPRWHPATPSDHPDAAADNGEGRKAVSQWPAAKLYGSFAAASAVVVAAAWLLTRAGDALATQTGLGGGFVGFAMLSFATTLPEMSTTVSAARAGNSEMAISNILGSSAFNVVILGVTGLVCGSEVMAQVGSPTAAFAAALGMAAILTYLWGLLEHEDRTILRMGWDSVVVLILAVVGCGVIYLLDQSQ